MSNNVVAERTLLCVALGRNHWTCVGSDEDGRRTAGMYALVETAKLNDINPREWLAYVLARLRGPGRDAEAKQTHAPRGSRFECHRWNKGRGGRSTVVRRG